MNEIVNAVSVDVEEYFQVSAFENYIDRNDWDTLPKRLDHNIDRILSLFSRFDVKGTFFVLGWIAERYPEAIRKIVQAGHEIASHGYSHVRVGNQTPAEFREDIIRTKRILEEFCSTPVIGYRAASYSIDQEHHWAHEELVQAGYLYSSSIYPIHHDLYGIPDATRFAYRVKSCGILEIPISTAILFGRRMPCGGGGYFRLYPYALSRFLIERLNRKENMPSVFYFHPWELDLDQPRPNTLDIRTRTRHYLNLDRMENRLSRLLSDFRWDRMDKVFIK